MLSFFALLAWRMGTRCSSSRSCSSSRMRSTNEEKQREEAMIPSFVQRGSIVGSYVANKDFFLHT